MLTTWCSTCTEPCRRGATCQAAVLRSNVRGLMYNQMPSFTFDTAWLAWLLLAKLLCGQACIEVNEKWAGGVVVA